MRILYLDGSSGIAGDMLLGALLDLGVEFASLKRRLAAMPLRGYTVTARNVERRGIGGTKFDVKVGRDHVDRGWREIREIVESAGYEDAVREPALAVFRRLIEVEATIHRVPFGKVHLHEVGAVDAILDIVGAVLAMRDLLGDGGRLHVAPLRLGSGTVTMEHGTFPVPAPATAALLKGFPAQGGPVEGELVTPTGAAIVTTLAHGFGPMPPMTILGVGYGAGTRQYGDHPNLLRAILGETDETPSERGRVTVIECTIDDMNPQVYGWLMERLYAAGALEVFWTPVQMKKNRPGTLVTVVAPPERLGEMTGTILRESTTIGLRHTLADRVEMARETVTVRTPYGPIRVKVSFLDGAPAQAQPEYEDCRRLAASRRVPLKEVQAAAHAAWRASRPAPGAAPPVGGRAAAGPASPRRRSGSRAGAAPPRTGRRGAGR